MNARDFYEADFCGFGYRELDLAADLLKKQADEPADFLGDDIKVCFNANSGMVFLSDEDYNVAVEENGKLVQFFTCPECGAEGTDLKINSENDGCDQCKKKA